MDLADYRQTYYDASGKASDNARNLALAGLAIVWIFRTGDTNPLLPRTLLTPLVLLAAALASDLAQYVAGTLVWGIYYSHLERKFNGRDPDPGFRHPRVLNWPALLFFWLKIVLVGAAYITIGRFLYARWIIAGLTSP